MRKLWIIIPALILHACVTPSLCVDDCMDPLATNYNSEAQIQTDKNACEYTQYDIINNFVSAEKIARLHTGMSKSESAMALGASPNDILHANQSCEIYSYEYRDMERELILNDEFMTESMLTRGAETYSATAKQVYLVFRNSVLESVITDDAKDKLEAVLCFKDQCSSDENYIVCRGCTDPEALNFNAEANLDDGSCEYKLIIIAGCMDPEAINYDGSATESNDSCQYCPCDYILNPNYDPRRDCSEVCILDPALDFIYGCTDPKAINYEMNATRDDGSCVHCPCATEEYYYVINDDRGCQGDPCIKVMREVPKEVEEKDCDLCDFLDLDSLIVRPAITPLNLELDMKLKNIKTNE